MRRNRGLFITLEGPDGSGKSTQLKLISASLRKAGYPVLTTREPGGSPQSRKIRSLVLHAKGTLSPSAELLLFLADRAQHVTELIGPALDQGLVVLCDRFTDSTVAYQGGGRGFPVNEIEHLNQVATGGLSPDLTLLFDLDAPRGLKRAAKRGAADRMEKEGREFHQQVRKAFLALAKRAPKRVKVIKVSGKTPGQVRDAAMLKILEAL